MVLLEEKKIVRFLSIRQKFKTETVFHPREWRDVPIISKKIKILTSEKSFHASTREHTHRVSR